MKWYFIELPKFRKVHPDMDDKLNQWLAVLDNYDRGLIEMAEKKNKKIEKAREEITYLTGDAAVRRIAELREKWEHDYADTKEFGRKEGIAEGEEKQKREIAKELLNKGFEIKLISEVTKLSIEEIELIRENMK